MKTAVLIKQVPDTETKIVINAGKNGIDDANVKFILSPYDEVAVEQAIQVGSETTVISMGSEKCVEAIRTALAMGIQKAIHIDTAGTLYDVYQTAAALAAVIKDGGYDLILCGKQAIDYDNASIPQMVAELISAPQVMVVDKMEVSGNSIKTHRRVSGGAREVYNTTTPVVLSCERGLNTPRYASLPGIMKAKSKPVEKKAAADVLGGAAPLVTFVNYELPPERAAGKQIPGEPADQVATLVKLLREEAKVI